MSSIINAAQVRGKRPSCTAVYIQTFFLDAGVTKVRRKQMNRLPPRLKSGYENGAFVTYVENAGISR
jgi:hypothetical protein